MRARAELELSKDDLLTSTEHEIKDRVAEHLALVISRQIVQMVRIEMTTQEGPTRDDPFAVKYKFRITCNVGPSLAESHGREAQRVRDEERHRQMEEMIRSTRTSNSFHLDSPPSSNPDSYNQYTQRLRNDENIPSIPISPEAIDRAKKDAMHIAMEPPMHIPTDEEVAALARDIEVLTDTTPEPEVDVTGVRDSIDETDRRTDDMVPDEGRALRASDFDTRVAYDETQEVEENEETTRTMLGDTFGNRPTITILDDIEAAEETETENPEEDITNTEEGENNV